MAITDTSTLTNTIDSINNVAKALKYAVPYMAYCNFGQKDVIAERAGDTIKWYRPQAASEVTGTLAETPTFSPTTHAVDSITAKLELRGDGKQITELLDIYSVFDLRTDLQRWAGESAAKSLNGITRNVLTAGVPTGQYLYVNNKSASTLGTADTADLATFAEAARKLRDSDAPAFNLGGQPVYIAMISPKVKTDLMNTTAFREAVRYADANRLFYGHVGTMNGILFVETSTANGATANTTAAITADQSLVIGDGFYGVPAMPMIGGAGNYPEASGITIDSQMMAGYSDQLRKLFQIVITQPGDGNGGGAHGDEYAMKYKVAWKALYKAVILNSNWGYLVRSARAIA